MRKWSVWSVHNNRTMAFFVIFAVLLTALAVDAGHSMHNPFFCYMQDPIRSITDMHSTITSYEAIRRFNFTTVNPYVQTYPNRKLKTFYQSPYIACTASRFWYLGRYGGRYPLLDNLNAIIAFAESSVSRKKRILKRS